ncbi:MAG: N-6 DNA methylase [Deltaproteobacteria bacterium]|nr:N-6 DNA methylase [Deltaproteobacteria bacterium]
MQRPCLWGIAEAPALLPLGSRPARLSARSDPRRFRDPHDAGQWAKLASLPNLLYADGYAQAVTFGLQIARARGIPLGRGLDPAAGQLGNTNSLIGTALRVLTENVESQATLDTSVGTLTRVLDVVDWSVITRGHADAWLYFYEDFLAVHDNAPRKLAGSYYTPPQVVETMVRLVDEVLRTRFGQHRGIASPAVTVADPAVGTGTYVLDALRRIAATVESDVGPDAVPAAIDAAMGRIIAFETQLGPFAVAPSPCGPMRRARSRTSRPRSCPSWRSATAPRLRRRTSLPTSPRWRRTPRTRRGSARTS